MSVRSREIRDEDGTLLGRVAGFVTSMPRCWPSNVWRKPRPTSACSPRIRPTSAETGSDGTITWVSLSIEHVLGWSTEDIIGTRLSRLMHPEDLPSPREYDET